MLWGDVRFGGGPQGSFMTTSAVGGTSPSADNRIGGGPHGSFITTSAVEGTLVTGMVETDRLIIVTVSRMVWSCEEFIDGAADVLPAEVVDADDRRCLARC